MLLAVLLLAPGCGFQLRGEVELPPVLRTTYLAAGSAPAQFVDVLRRSLLDAGATLASEPVSEGSVLKISQVSEDKRVLSVDSVTGKVREYELHFAVRFSLADARGRTLIDPQWVGVTRDFRFSETEVLGKSEEEGLLKREMYDEVVRQLVRRVVAQTPAS
ncbi:MAG: LPS assembly lipoprotein LptE [Gammaproteobacteria bacterium]